MNVFEYIKKYPENNKWLHLFPLTLKRNATDKSTVDCWKTNSNILHMKMCKVSDDWFPSFPGEFILITAESPKYSNPYRLLAMGMDDNYMEKTYSKYCVSEYELDSDYLSLSNNVNFKELFVMGLNY